MPTKISDNIAERLIQKIGKFTPLRRIFHEEHYCLEKELKNIDSVLDIGCGPSSPLQKCKNISYSVGVDAHKPALEVARKNKTHSVYINEKIQNVDFKEREFDAVIIIGLLEHLKKEESVLLLKKAELWARKKVIISVPNKFCPQKVISKNVYQRHQSSWTVSDFIQRKYKVHGITGAKFMYKNEPHRYHAKYTTKNLRFHPQVVAFILNAILQIFVYFLPNEAFTLFAVKNLTTAGE